MESKDPLLAALESRFGHPRFRPGQREVVEAVLGGEDVVAVMPTGGGKSLCYQLPALLLDGLTLVVSPLIALMKDQVDALRSLGHDATFVNSLVGPEEQRRRLAGCAEGRHRLLYIAPERLSSPRFLEALAGTRVVRLAVDEAHCISQWGHDFRPDYMRLGELRASLGSPPTAAFTATATQEVREDVVRQLALAAPRVFVAGFERPNLRLIVRRPGSVAEKLELLEESLLGGGRPAIVYAATRRHVEEVTGHLASRGVRAAAYHAGLAAGERERVQDAFMAGAVPVIVATNAFGMGVDKPDIRLVLHYDLPGSVEAYYQEAGRAGRDGAPADCVLLYNYADVRIQRFFLEGSNPEPQVFEYLLEALEGGTTDTASLASGCPVRNPMAVETALGLLRRAEVLERTSDPSSFEEHFRLVRDVPRGEIPIDLDRLRAKRAADEERLRAICGYAAGGACRRAYVLHYFGSEEARERCEACDRCLKIGHASARELTESERLAVRIALSGVARVNDRYGRSRLAHFLSGSRSREVTASGLDQLPTHGKLAHLPLRAVGDLLEALADEGLLRRRALDGPGSGAILSLTEEGRRVMMEDPPLRLAIPDLAAASAAASPRGRRSARLGRAARADLAPADPALVRRLRDFRVEEARRQGVPAYVVFPDATLEAIAAARPASAAELGALPGIGPARLERYGTGILAALGASEAAT